LACDNWRLQESDGADIYNKDYRFQETIKIRARRRTGCTGTPRGSVQQFFNSPKAIWFRFRKWITKFALEAMRGFRRKKSQRQKINH